jgi:glucan phosphoethanolaminetransferase (alkaline phosphatase superfamily)
VQNNSDIGTYFVLIVGESARSDRFALNGYKHGTNTRLARVPNLVSFSDCHALDTSTLKAVPHIFMHERKSKEDTITKETSLIHILKHVGFKTFWLSRCKGQYQSIIHDIALESDMTVYASGLWHYNADNIDILQYDHSLLQPLQEAIKDNDGGLIVLHTKGSHIDYRSRVPKEIYSVTHNSKVSFDESNSLESSYDSTIKYTDLFLSDVITILKNKKAILLYISDHGESLGEGGVYAHNAPLDKAPKEQTHIPMIWWASDKFLSNPVNAVRFANIRANALKYVDQSYVFHSVLDCLGIQSSCINKNKSVCTRWS